LGLLSGGLRILGTTDFTLPGEDVIDGSPPSDKIRVFGSSVSTALAAGLCALMLYCVQVHISHAPEKEKDQLRREFAQI